MARAAEIAREHRIPVTVDVDTIYHGFDRVLPHVDYLVASSEFPVQWTDERDPFRALEMIQEEYRHAGGRHDAGRARARWRAWRAASSIRRRFVVNCVDTTGAGDVFHGAFCYAVLQNMPMREALEFSNAMAALNCTALGARGGISTVDAGASSDRARRAPVASRLRAVPLEPDALNDSPSILRARTTRRRPSRWC